MSNLKIKSQYIEGCIVALVGVFILIMAFKIPNNPAKLVGNAPTIMKILTEARIIPVILSLIIMFIGTRIASEKTSEPTYWNVGETLLFIKQKSRVLFAIAITLAYVFIIGKLHFYLATLLFLFGIMMFLQYKEVKSIKTVAKILAIAVVSTFFTAFFIPYGLNMILP